LLAIVFIAVSKANEFYYLLPLFGLVYMGWQIFRALQEYRKIEHQPNPVSNHFERRKWR
jgi:hypothetical protein